MERGVAILLGGFAIAGVICLALLLSGLVKVDVAIAPASSVHEVAEAMSMTANVSISKDGAIAINGHATDLERMPADLDKAFRAMGAATDNRQQAVVIWADPDLPKSDFDPILDRLKAGGWSKIRLSASTQKALALGGHKAHRGADVSPSARSDPAAIAK